jgi:hypothetical protein
MDAIRLNVYDDDDKIIKTSEAQIIDLRYGVIRNIMELLNVDDIDDTSELLKTVYSAWSQITKILGKVFPEMTDEDWENVKLSELIPILVLILKSSFTQILSVPTDSKN